MKQRNLPQSIYNTYTICRLQAFKVPPNAPTALHYIIQHPAKYKS